MANPYRLQEREDAWVLSLGQSVTGLLLGTQFILQLHDPGQGNVSICIENVFRLLRGRAVEEFDPAEPTALGPALVVVHKVVRQAIAFKDGQLRIEFEDGSRILCAPHREFEAWRILGPDRRSPMLIVCEIYGRLHVWPGQD